MSLLILLVVVCVIAVLMIAMVSSSVSTSAGRNTPPPCPMIKVKKFRPGRAVPPATGMTVPPEWGQEIRLPEAVQRPFGQKKCTYCHDSILESYANKGWMRCRATGKLVHTYCYEAVQHCPTCSSNSCSEPIMWRVTPAA